LKKSSIDTIKTFIISCTDIPKTLMDKINNFIDEVVKDKNKLKQLDAGKTLAGQVTEEIFLPKEVIDGEMLGNTPVHVKVLEKEIEVLV